LNREIKFFNVFSLSNIGCVNNFVELLLISILIDLEYRHIQIQSPGEKLAEMPPEIL